MICRRQKTIRTRLPTFALGEVKNCNCLCSVCLDCAPVIFGDLVFVIPIYGAFIAFELFIIPGSSTSAHILYTVECMRWTDSAAIQNSFWN